MFPLKSPFHKLKIDKSTRMFIALLLFGCVFRLALLPFGNHDDIFSNADWGRWIYIHGPRGFYETQGWLYSSPTQMPILNLLMDFSYIGYSQTLHLLRLINTLIKPFPSSIVLWWEQTLYKDTNFLYGYLMWMKIPAVMADMVLAIIFYRVGRNALRGRQMKAHIRQYSAVITSALFLFLPFSWYISALWGQFDQLGSLLVLISFLLLFRRQFTFSSLFLLIAGEIKPTAAFLVPLYVFYFLYQKPRFKDILFSFIANVILFFITTTPFTEKNPFVYVYTDIYPKVVFGSRLVVGTNVFNVWQFIYPSHVPPGGDRITLGLPAYVWGYVFLLILFALSIFTITRFAPKNPISRLERLFIALYITSAGTYIFGIGMLDRYFYSAIVFLGLLACYNTKLLKWWVITCLLYWINLFYSWGFPFIEKGELWKNLMFIRSFSFLQIVMFFVCIYQIGVIQFLQNETISLLQKVHKKI